MQAQDSVHRARARSHTGRSPAAVSSHPRHHAYDKSGVERTLPPHVSEIRRSASMTSRSKPTRVEVKTKPSTEGKPQRAGSAASPDGHSKPGLGRQATEGLTPRGVHERQSSSLQHDSRKRRDSQWDYNIGGGDCRSASFCQKKCESPLEAGESPKPTGPESKSPGGVEGRRRFDRNSHPWQDSEGKSNATGSKQEGLTMAAHFWISQELDYADILPDGFYQVWGEFPEAENRGGRLPSLDSLAAIRSRTAFEDAREVLLVDEGSDDALLQLKAQARAACAGVEALDKQVEKLAALATQKMGGVSVSGDAGLRMAFNREITKVKRSSATYVVRLGEVRVGLARHRALLFKVLACSVKLRCRLVQEEAQTRVLFRWCGAEWSVDMLRKPGHLTRVDGAGKEAAVPQAGFASKAADASACGAGVEEDQDVPISVDPAFENAVGDLIESHGMGLEEACDALVLSGGDLMHAHLVCQGADMFNASLQDTAMFLEAHGWDLEVALDQLLQGGQSVQFEVQQLRATKQAASPKSPQPDSCDASDSTSKRSSSARKSGSGTKDQGTSGGVVYSMSRRSEMTEEEKRVARRESRQRQKLINRAQVAAELAAKQAAEAKQQRVEATAAHRAHERINEMNQTQTMQLRDEAVAVQVREEFELSHGVPAQEKDLAGTLRLFGIKVGNDPKNANPSAEEIRKAYREALRMYHPDKQGHKEIRERVFATEVFKLINKKMGVYSA
mmetsp:Transcript_31165/g.60136  ORF Transcript_31165/g.60136 Transcript_31165/m.60136 type:complete len:731 (+) Transcript_31165:123-2315(+)